MTQTLYVHMNKRKKKEIKRSQPGDDSDVADIRERLK
jgi:hypothetical protein